MNKVYQFWPNDRYQDKHEIWQWCDKSFGPGNVEEGGWSVTSHYDERPITEDRNPCPFLFTTTDPKKLTFFALRWS